MNNPLSAFLAQRPWMILDGALATELERRGADLADPLWSAKCLIERPDLIRAVHLDYFAAGGERERRGPELADPLWSAKCLIERPDLIRAVHPDYFAAGADVATTATYQASFEGFARRGIAHGPAGQVMRDAVARA